VASLAREGAPSRRFDSEEALLDEVARHLEEGRVVGWMHGRMEFGPRALGARSILGDPRSAAMQSTMNLKIKFRESFRPFAPAVLRERAGEWFDLPEGVESPYMLLVAQVHASKEVATEGEEKGLRGLDRLKVRRSLVPAVTHVDRSARLQTVDAERNPRFHRLLRRFEERTGCPVLVNTSFNVRGEPLVRTPEDAYRCFLATEMDVLVLEDHLLLKAEQPRAARDLAAAHRARFAPD
jgi:carbamoyltransferase